MNYARCLLIEAMVVEDVKNQYAVAGLPLRASIN